MKREFGGTFLGFVIGVVVGLGAALAVAVYVTKVPIPFINKGQSRSAEQDDAETKKNKDWDPNAPLYGKNPAKTTAPVVPASSPALVPAGKLPGATKAEAKVDTKVDGKAESKTEPKPAVTADPLGDLAKAKMAPAEPFTYFIQVGAYRTSQDADAQRAKLSLTGIETKISEREQSGSVVYRVRVGPFDKKDEAEKAKEKLEAAGVETALVRVQR
jgi:cell division protein FtsN